MSGSLFYLLTLIFMDSKFNENFLGFILLATCKYCYIASLTIVNYTVHCIPQFSSVSQSCPTLCDPMNHSTPGLPVHHQLPKFTQTHVHQVGDAT